jgi:hypothetical protein
LAAFDCPGCPRRADPWFTFSAIEITHVPEMAHHPILNDPVGLFTRNCTDGGPGIAEVNSSPSLPSLRTRAFADLRPLREIAAPVD